MLETELEGLVMVFLLNVVFLWKIFNCLLLKTNNQLKILDIGQQSHTKLNHLMSLNDLFIAKSLAFNTARISRMTTEFLNRPIFLTDEQIDNKKIEENIVKSILNDEKIELPTDTDHISLPNTAEEIKQQSIDENKLFTETELKKITKEMLKR